MRNNNQSTLLQFLLILFLSFSLSFFHLTAAAAAAAKSKSKSSIVYSNNGRSLYRFDIFSSPVAAAAADPQNEIKLTDGVSVNYNGYFTSNGSLLYVSERNGDFNIYLTSHHSPSPFTFPLLQPSSSEDQDQDLDLSPPPYSMKDRPSVSGDHLIYVSTHQPCLSPRQSWAAVYSTHLPTAKTRRLTPHGVADFSPSVSPSGRWTAVASSGELGWSGEIEGLNTSIYVFSTADGSDRRKVIERGGWPCWADDATFYFHRQSQDDGWWSVYRARIDGRGVVVSVDRVTPPGFHAFTPAATVGSPEIVAVATRRGDSEFRHIEILHLGSNSYVEVTRPVAPFTNNYNPFLSPDGTRVGYHRCRGGAAENGSPQLLLETVRSPFPEEYSLFRFDGSFQSFSPDGKRIAFAGFGSGWDTGLYVVDSDGSGRPRKLLDGNPFYTAWDWKREGVIYTSLGKPFGSLKDDVYVVSVTIGAGEPVIRKLTEEGTNSAFPSPSPDGKWVVFRSGRSGHKNLYIMDAEQGESGGVQQLTDGPWTDTMCTWSPDGEWIAFDSDRDNPRSNSFAIYMVHPNGTGLRKVAASGDGGRTDHAWFSPDSKSIVFTTDYAAVSAEPIALPHHFQPYGEIFTVNIDGSDLRRVTHNSYEDGTPTWTPFSLEPVDVAEREPDSICLIDDCLWLSPVADSALAGTGCSAGK